MEEFKIVFSWGSPASSWPGAFPPSETQREALLRGSGYRLEALVAVLVFGVEVVRLVCLYVIMCFSSDYSADHYNRVEYLKERLLTAVSSSRYTLMVLSASAVIRRLSEWSNTQEKIPDSLSREPGCTAAWIRWKLYPVLQSHMWIVPLSAGREGE